VTVPAGELVVIVPAAIALAALTLIGVVIRRRRRDTDVPPR
jgi:LPXTG-motif cell wall-anchored protein